MMADIECEICFRPFNGVGRKPRNLPCGHVSCTSCIDENISRGFVYCSTCRSPHHARSASDLPVNFFIMKLVDQPPKPDKPEETADDFNGGLCPEHKSSNLYFVCRSHNKEVCRECTVLSHNPTICDVISFKDQMEEKRTTILNEVDAEIISIKESISHLNEYERSRDNDVKYKNGEVERLLIEIDEDRKDSEKAKKAKIQSTKIKKSLESAREKLNSAAKKVEIKESCSFVKDKVRCSLIWTEDLMKNFDYKLSESLFIKNPRSFLRMFPSSKQKVFIVHHEGSIQRSAELKVKDGMTVFNSLDRNVTPTQDAITIKAQLSLGLDLTTKLNLSKVFITFVSEDINCIRNQRIKGFGHPINTDSTKQVIGTVYISIDKQAPQAKQFLSLFTGIQGYTYKGIRNVSNLGNYAISNSHCTQENGKQCSTRLFSQNYNKSNVLEAGKVCLIGNCGFMIYHDVLPSSQNSEVVGSVVSGLETISKVADLLRETVSQPSQSFDMQARSFGSFGSLHNVNTHRVYHQNQVQISIDEVGVVVQ